nr:MAG TPA: hypothetical protein [Caudoviricetes sp.]
MFGITYIINILLCSIINLRIVIYILIITLSRLYACRIIYINSIITAQIRI